MLKVRPKGMVKRKQLGKIKPCPTLGAFPQTIVRFMVMKRDSAGPGLALGLFANAENLEIKMH